MAVSSSSHFDCRPDRSYVVPAPFFFTRVRIQHLSSRVLFFKKPSYSILVVKGELRPAPLFVLIMGPGTCVDLCHSNVMRAADVEILFLLFQGAAQERWTRDRSGRRSDRHSRHR